MYFLLTCSGVQQQLSSGRTDEMAAGKHPQAGVGAHAGAADGCRAALSSSPDLKCFPGGVLALSLQALSPRGRTGSCMSSGRGVRDILGYFV